MAVNCLVVPLAADGLAGVTAILDSVAAVTVSTVEPLTPRVALIVLGPVLSACARPALLIVATAGVADAHATEPVMFAVEPSE